MPAALCTHQPSASTFPTCRYKEALRRCPDCPAEVRLGLAVCYFKLGNLHKAMAAYERVLDLSPSSTPALLGLAVLKMQFGSSHQVHWPLPLCGALLRAYGLPAQHVRLGMRANTHSLPCPAPSRPTPPCFTTPPCLPASLPIRVQDVREGSQLLVQAFQQDPQNQHLLVLLAHFCLRQSFPAKALRLAQRALQLATSDAVRAEALTIVARAHHALNQLQEAYRHYQQVSHQPAGCCLLCLQSIVLGRGSPLRGCCALPRHRLANWMASRRCPSTAWHSLAWCRGRSLTRPPF